ncbi:MAG: histidine kinase [Bacteroidetes bacterium]|nr:histidine kinase [Bacteroidota bacterium]
MKKNMEQRIKIVWLLSILAILLITAGQGYWLWNQYEYANHEKAEEAYSLAMKAIAGNDSLRSLQAKSKADTQKVNVYKIKMLLDTRNGKYENNLLMGVTTAQKGKKDNSKKAGRNAEKSTRNDETNQLKGRLTDLTHQKNIAYKDSFNIYSNTASAMNPASLISLYRINEAIPFSLPQLDSLLADRLPNVNVRTQLEVANDTTFSWDPIKTTSGPAWNTLVTIRYAYNPLKHQWVSIQLHVVPHEVLLRMGWQLLGSICLVVLLALCLLFQIKTILKQRRIDELRKSFVNTMIHELKRPVQALKMCVAFMNDKSLRTNEKAMDEVVRDSIFELDELSAYLSKLRDMTRAEDQHTQLSIATFDIKKLVEKLIRLHQHPAGKKVTIATHLSENSLVTADPVHISNIISNLIENSVKYSGQEVHIDLGITLSDHVLTMKVSDNGIGIPLSEQGKVFEKFYRAGNLPDRSIPGIGLGLSYVKLLAEAHRGKVSLASQPGKGTQIEINIPQ